MKNILKICILSSLITLSQAAELEYSLNQKKSEIKFKVNAVTPVDGIFEKFEGKYIVDTKTKNLISLTGTVDTNSVNTNLLARDESLKNFDFFDVSKFPKMNLIMKKSSLENNKGTIEVDLTIKGITKTIILNAELTGPIFLANGKDKTTLKLTGKLNRTDFGMVWNQKLDNGDFLVGDEIDIEIFLDGKGIS